MTIITGIDFETMEQRVVAHQQVSRVLHRKCPPKWFTLYDECIYDTAASRIAERKLMSIPTNHFLATWGARGKYRVREQGLDKRLGCEVFRVTTKVLSCYMQQGERVPNMDVWYYKRKIPDGYIEFEPPLATVVMWFRRHKIEQLRDAIATLSMLGHDKIEVIRSFGT